MCDITLGRILREIHPIKGFIYRKSNWDPDKAKTLRVEVSERRGSRGICSGCGKKGAGYDRQPERQWGFVPLWELCVVLAYAPRRIDCRNCGPTIERVPWASGKHRNSDVFRLFLAQWARLLSWAEVARCFHVQWADVYRAVEWVVDFGIEHRDLSGVTALGVDEIYVGKKAKFWTLVYQIDDHCKRLLWIGEDRTESTFDLFFEVFGEDFCKGIRFLCSDMWKPYLNSAAYFLPNVLHILDRFHIVKKLNEAIDTVRREETRSRAAAGLAPPAQENALGLPEKTPQLDQNPAPSHA